MKVSTQRIQRILQAVEKKLGILKAGTPMFPWLEGDYNICLQNLLFIF